jgi:F-type H+-transporting ATPase subunit alpha
VLRELLKQDRLAPLPETVQLGWMIAFNEGLFEAERPEKAGAALADLADFLPTTGLTLQSPREAWRAALTEFMAAGQPGASR